MKLRYNNEYGIIKTKRDKISIRADEYTDKGYVNYTPYKSLFGDNKSVIRLLYTYGIGYCRVAVKLYKSNTITLPELLGIWFNGKNDTHVHNLLKVSDEVCTGNVYYRKESYYGK